jgi:TonB family protein
VDSGEITLEQATAAISRIFLSTDDHLSEVVPRYWRDCLVNVGKNLDAGCRFGATVLAVPGVQPSTGVSPRVLAASAQQVDSDAPKFKAGKGLISPQLTKQSDPPFTEAARRAKVQGTVVLAVVVDQTGVPRNIRIVDPLGCGLDAQAARTIQTWRFKPAERDGKPIAVEIEIQMNFHS